MRHKAATALAITPGLSPVGIRCRPALLADTATSEVYLGTGLDQHQQFHEDKTSKESGAGELARSLANLTAEAQGHRTTVFKLTQTRLPGIFCFLLTLLASFSAIRSQRHINS